MRSEPQHQPAVSETENNLQGVHKQGTDFTTNGFRFSFPVIALLTEG